MFRVCIKAHKISTFLTCFHTILYLRLDTDNRVKLYNERKEVVCTMATLYVKTPGGTQVSVNLATMNIESDLQQNGWCKLPNGLIIQWTENEVI